MTTLLERVTAALADRYAIVRELGAGGMATVYVAEDRKHHREVAVKVLRPELAAVIGADRFLSEIRTTAKLQHPNILPLFDSGEADGFLYYVMPLVAGESLRQRLDRETQLPIADALRIASQVAAGLDYAHRHGVIHRDIKPENILLHEEAALIADFGIALAVSKVGTTRMTETGMSLGTPHYMSPEQAMGQREITAGSDVYALGAVTYEMLAGEPPFTGPTPQAIVAKVVTTEPVPLRVVRSTVPEAVNEAVLTALAKVPADRYPTTARFAEALRRTEVAGAGGAAPARPRRYLAWAAAAVAILALLLFTQSRVAASRRLTVTSTRAVTTELGLFLDPALSPDGKLLAYAAGPASRTRLYVRSLDGGRAIALTDSMPGRHRWPRWSPDGSRIAFMAAGTGIVVVPALGGPARVVVAEPEGRGPPLQSPAWSPDGKRLAYALGSRIRSLDLESNLDTLIADVADSGSRTPAFQLAWSPDGKWIAAAVGNFRFAFGGADLGSPAPASLVVASVASGRVTRITSDTLGNVMELSPAWTADGRRLLFVSSREGGRDVYELALDGDMEPAGAPHRLTTGLNAHSISLTNGDRLLAYSTFQPVSNIWAIPIPAGDDAPASSGRDITHSTALIEEVSVSPDGASLAFTSNRSGNADLYRMPSQGGAVVQLTSDSTDEFGPAWSPDGREILFSARRAGRRQLMVLPADAGGPAQRVGEVAGTRGEDWAPDGRSLVLGSANPRDSLRRVDRTSTGWGSPQPIPGTAGGTTPRWAPDGRSIVFVRGQNPATLFSVPSAGGTARALTTSPSQASGPAPLQPMWARDARAIYYLATDSSGSNAIWSISPDGGSPRRRVRFTDPDLQPGGMGRFGVDAKTFYVRLVQLSGTIGTAGLVRR